MIVSTIRTIANSFIVPSSITCTPQISFHKLSLSMARKVHLHFVERIVQMVHSLEGATWNEQ